MKYSEKEMADAIDNLISIIANSHDGTDLLYKFQLACEKHPVIQEIYNYGPNGPAGIGLGNFGGHAVG